MKIALTHKDGEIFQNFKALKEVIIFTEKDGKIETSEVISVEEFKDEALVGVLVFYDVNILICGGIDGKLLSSLLSVGIRTYPGVKGKCEDEAMKIISGDMDFQANSSCHHH